MGGTSSRILAVLCQRLRTCGRSGGPGAAQGRPCRFVHVASLPRLAHSFSLAASPDASHARRNASMIDLYTWSTPNGRKVSIMLEECGLSYTAHAIDIGKGDQFKPEFLKISPNNRIPAIVDRDNGRSLFESGAILMYLAEKTGKFWPKDPDGHWRTVEWLMWQMGGVGPMFGQVHHFVKYNKGKAPYAE